MAAAVFRSQVTLRGTSRSTVPGSAPITTTGSPMGTVAVKEQRRRTGKREVLDDPERQPLRDGSVPITGTH